MGGDTRLKGAAMTAAGSKDLTVRDLDAIALRFLQSEFAEPAYANWPIERRLDAYLSHNRLADVDHDDGSACDALLQRVMANISRIRRSGTVRSSNRPELS